jgi:glutaminyl-tRNA synthetase
LYEHLFTKEDPEEVPEGVDWVDNVNPKSLETLIGCKVEPFLASANKGQRYQFERLGYFCVDSIDASPGHLLFNRTATLRDTWAKMEKLGRKS